MKKIERLSHREKKADFWCGPGESRCLAPTPADKLISSNSPHNAIGEPSAGDRLATMEQMVI